LTEYEHKLYTWCWRDALKYEGEDIVLVRTSVGHPRWIPKEVSREIPAVEELMPKGLLGGDIPTDEWKRRYRQRLEEFGETEIREALAAIYRQHEGRPLVLLCFEHDPVDCHRSVFAEWWEEQTGVAVPEFGPIAAKPDAEPKNRQESLI